MEDDQKDGMLETRLVRVRGLVQGIGYREACVRRAHALGVTGWVRNRIDGSVEVMVQGSPEQLAEMCAWLSEGMSAALVDRLEVTEVPPPFARFEHFERLPTL
ncbi:MULTISPECIES: acylphosphatase [Paraburkholderia]|jgi:acylphosphatase|uniref:acylphosphatase n=1 Tax=Paraburkholderia madseniana TaxID=2599607 RepID=A0A6N6WGX5_9BURK|nr:MULTISPECIES: acylphosphatase [Paraburkholderia]KAE8759034.1 acylphosphatase [Paraburkholderia madseniana]MCX4151283.1 acylphosphatase [Paraburkholderia madseniana]MCX4171273.1 acylphosphatase [Paraburkholderia madseniana]MDN7154215.1 acylphosphatase [Paraburkholderia sp. WS6]MDQ6413097.1 acylphosphatase [Paraburkholderia madseniana]